MRFSTNLVPLRLEPSESASLGDSYHVRRVRLNLMTLRTELLLYGSLLFLDIRPAMSYTVFIYIIQYKTERE